MLDLGSETRSSLEEKLPLELRNKLRELKERFPGSVSFLPKGTVLYHRSLKPDELVAMNKFDITKAIHPDYGAYFTHMPIDITNVQVVLRDPIILFDVRDKSCQSNFDKMVKEADEMHLGTNRYLSGLGFNGEISKGSSGLTFYLDELGGMANSYEVNIFTPSLPALSGRFSLYKSGIK